MFHDKDGHNRFFLVVLAGAVVLAAAFFLMVRGSGRKPVIEEAEESGEVEIGELEGLGDLGEGEIEKELMELEAQEKEL